MYYILRRRGLGNTSCQGIKHFSEEGIGIWRNDKPVPHDVSGIIRWGCTSNTPHGVPVVNKAKAIHFVADKLSSRMVFAQEGLAPQTWTHVDDLEYPLRAPVVVRRATHHQGRWLHLCEDEASVRASVALYGHGNYYISEYIPKVSEYRVFICAGRVVWVAQKTPANVEDVAWNVAKGGRFDNVRWGDWPLDVVSTAILGFAKTGLDFGGVDVMVGPDGTSYILEINSAPSQTSPYRQSCVAKAFDYHIQGEDWSSFRVAQEPNWKYFIHPSLTENAMV